MKKIIFKLIIPLFLFTLILSCSSTEEDESELIQDETELIQVDNTPPVITLIGESIIEIFRNTNFTDPGATAYDNNDGNLSSIIEITGNPVLTDTNGEYIKTYSVSDAAGNTASVERRVIVYDAGNPLVGDIANGGVVFWVNPQENTHGLVAAISCEASDFRWPSMPWRPNLNLGDCQYNGPYNLIGNTEIGGGLENTDRIIALNTLCDGGIKTNYAAYFARNYSGGGYNDWYLPNTTEFELIQSNFSTIRQTVYSENCAQNHWVQAFNNVGSTVAIWTSNGDLYTAKAGYAFSIQPMKGYNKEETNSILPIRAY